MTYLRSSSGLLKEVSVAPASLLLAWSPAQAVLLTGNTVAVKTHAVEQGGAVINGTTSTAVAPGSASVDGTPLTATYTDSTITLADLTPGSSITFFTNSFPSEVPLTFNGVQFTTAATTPAFTAVAIDTALTNVSGFAVSFDAANLFLDLKGVTFNTGSRITLNLNGFAESVPEPATWTMLIVGFGVVGGAMRRRTSRADLAVG